MGAYLIQGSRLVSARLKSRGGRGRECDKMILYHDAIGGVESTLNVVFGPPRSSGMVD